MPLGDSITAGGYNEGGQWRVGGGYRLRLGARLRKKGAPFVFVGSLEDGPAEMPDRRHEGHSGWRIAELTTQIDGWLASGRPDLILLMIGTNDLWKEDRLESAPQRLEALVDRILAGAPNARIFVSTILTSNNEVFNTRARAYNAAVLRIRRPRVVVVDLGASSGITAAASDLGDGVHPTPKGYRKLGDAWYGSIVDSL